MHHAPTSVNNAAAHSAGRPTRASLLRSTLGAAALLVGLSACGGGADEPVADAAPAVTDAPATDPVATDTSVTDSPVAEAPVVSEAPVATEAPLVTDAPVVIELTTELAAFRDANSALVDEWSNQLSAFGDEAIEYLADVSKAPAAPATQELSDQLVAAIGSDTTDPGLVTMRDFAAAMSTAVGHSIDGDQETALNVFLELQAGQQQLTAVLDELQA